MAEGIDGAEAFVNPRAAPAVPNHLLQNIPRAPVRILQRPLVAEETDRGEAVPGTQVVSALVPRVDAGTFEKAGARKDLPVVSYSLVPHVDAGACTDPRTQPHQDQAQISKPGSDTASTTLSQIIRAAGIMHLDLSTTVTDSDAKNTSGLRRWKFEPPSRLPRARSNKKAHSARNEAFKRFKAQMDREKEEYDHKLWREGGWERKRDLRIVQWLEGIPAEAEREFEEGVV